MNVTSHTCKRNLRFKGWSPKKERVQRMAAKVAKKCKSVASKWANINPAVVVLTAAGRAKYNRETGSNLKAPQPGGGPRKRSFCARMKGNKDQ